MANVQITIPDPLVPRVKAAMRDRFPQHEALTDAQAFKAITGSFWAGVLADYERLAAERVYAAEHQATIRTAYETAVADGSTIG